MTSPSQFPVFTYWEGPMHPFTEVCIGSIARVYNRRHVHLTPNTLRDWIDVDAALFECEHLIFRSDFIRTKLLQRHGGWWFDADVLLFRNPDDQIVDELPWIWNLVYFHEGRWQPLVNCGILFSAPQSEWIDLISKDFDEVDIRGLKMNTENEDIGQQIYERWSVNPRLVRIGHEHAFNSTVNVNADFRPFFNGCISIETARYGLHIGASLARWAKSRGDREAEAILNAKNVLDLVCRFPLSVVAQYLRQYGGEK